MPFVAKSLLTIFNTSLETSKFPDTWKTARVAPIFKDGDKSIRSNYRPISVLPVVSRLFEKLVFNQLYKYLDSNRLLSNGQSGFRLLFSTLTCLLKTTDEWYDGFDNGYMIGSVFIDLRKAFDTIMRFYAKNSSTMEFVIEISLGFSPICLTGNSFVGLMV